MIYFIDTSAWIKFFIMEDGTQEIQDFILKESQSESNIFAAYAVTYAEMHATFKRSLNGNRLTEEQYNEAVSAFSDQWENVDIPVVNNLVIEESGKLAQKYAIKGCDAIQLASALKIHADLFINSDNDLQDAAKDSGLKVWNPVDGKFEEAKSYSERKDLDKEV